MPEVYLAWLTCLQATSNLDGRAVRAHTLSRFFVLCGAFLSESQHDGPLDYGK